MREKERTCPKDIFGLPAMGINKLKGFVAPTISKRIKVVCDDASGSKMIVADSWRIRIFWSGSDIRSAACDWVAEIKINQKNTAVLRKSRVRRMQRCTTLLFLGTTGWVDRKCMFLSPAGPGGPGLLVFVESNLLHRVDCEPTSVNSTEQ